MGHAPADPETVGTPKVLEGLPLSTHQSASPSEAYLRVLTERLSEGSFKDTIERIFTDLNRLLGYLSYMGSDLHKITTADEALQSFMLVEGEGRVLLDLIENVGFALPNLTVAERDAVEGASYVIRHELRRVFETELDRISTDSDNSLRSRIIHAHGILSNCFQQATVVLARALDPQADATRLFGDFDIRRKQSVLLEHDLGTLIRLSLQAEEEAEEHSLLRLIKSVDDFRNGSMRYLMFKDWETFETFAKQLIATRGTEECWTIVHRFSCYLEMLRAHVRMRVVLLEDETQA